MENILKPYEITPPEGYAVRNPKKRYPKDCYYRAFNYVMSDLSGLKLVHGICRIPGLGALYIHAWVEIETDIVFESALQKFYTKHGFYEVMRVGKTVEFTQLEAAKKSIEYGYYGDWAGLEIQKNKEQRLEWREGVEEE